MKEKRGKGGDERLKHAGLYRLQVTHETSTDARRRVLLARAQAAAAEAQANGGQQQGNSRYYVPSAADLHGSGQTETGQARGVRFGHQPTFAGGRANRPTLTVPIPELNHHPEQIPSLSLLSVPLSFNKTRRRMS